MPTASASRSLPPASPSKSSRPCLLSLRLGWRGYNEFNMRLRLALGIAALSVSMLSAPAQQPPPAENSDTRIILDVTSVNMLFTVTDKRGRFITDLTKTDFQV